MKFIKEVKSYKFVMMQLNIGHLLFPILSLIFFQFFGSVIALFTKNLSWVILLSAITSLASSFWIIRNTIEKISISSYQLLTMFLLTLSVSILFLFRINWHIYDYICPTGLLGLVNQVSHGVFPVSFLSFPEFIMNYHQGFIYLSGVISYVFNFEPSLSIQVTFLSLFALMNLLVMIYFISYKNKLFFLLPLLFIFISSVSTKHYLGMDLNFYNYLNIFEQSSSNSWPLAFIALISLLLFLKNFILTTKSILSVFLIALSISTINATFFSILVLTAPIIFLYKIYREKSFEYKYLGLCIILFSLLILIPRYVPSAFLVGDLYEAPQYGLRILETEIFKYIKHIVRYLLLSGPIVVLGLFLIYRVHKQKVVNELTILSAILIVSFFTPILFVFKNIDMWDNLHKFALINIFVSLLLVMYFANDKIFSFRVKSLIAICVILSIPATNDMFHNRLSKDFGSTIHPNKEILDVVTYLKNQNKILVPYKIDGGGLCDITGYAAVAQYSGNSLKDSYFENFLLSSEIESKQSQEIDWSKDTNSTLVRLKAREPNELFIISNKYKSEFLTILKNNKSFPIKQSVIEFNNYLIY